MNILENKFVFHFHLKKAFKVMLTRLRFDPIKYRRSRFEPIGERSQGITLKTYPKLPKETM